MLFNIIVRDVNGTVIEMPGQFVPGLDTIVVPLVNAVAGCEIQAEVRDDDSNLLGTFYAAHIFETKAVTATKLEDGTVAVTDDASNTYISE